MGNLRVEKEEYGGSRLVDINARLLAKGTVFLYGPITHESGETLIRQLLFLEQEGGSSPIRLLIHSPGGEVGAGLMLYDVLQGLTRPVDMYCMGLAASMAAVLFASGAKGRRYILPHAQTMIHEPFLGGDVRGSADSIFRAAESIQKTRGMVNGILAAHTGRSLREIEAVTSFDHYMDAPESVAFGLCDHIAQKLAP